MKKTTETFAKNLKRIREEQGLSLSDLGQLAGTSHANIKYIEDYGTSPKIEMAMAIANALKVDINELLKE